jgi:hypothetical protein
MQVLPAPLLELVVKEVARQQACVAPPAPALGTALPALLLHSALPVTVQQLLSAPGLQPEAAVRLQLAAARVLWHQAAFSLALDSLAAATAAWLALAPAALTDPLEEAAFLRPCPALAAAWHLLGRTATRARLGPALDYLEALAAVTGRREGGGLGGLPAYGLWLAVREEGARRCWPAGWPPPCRLPSGRRSSSGPSWWSA